MSTMSAQNPVSLTAQLERFPAKWGPVRVKKTRQIENPEPRSDSIGTKKGSRHRRKYRPAVICP
jgi:hypothetical protein